MSGELTRRIARAVAAVILGAMWLWVAVGHRAPEEEPGGMFLEYLSYTVLLGILLYIVLRWRAQSLFLHPDAGALHHGLETSGRAPAADAGGAAQRDQTRDGENSSDYAMDVIAAYLDFVKETPWKDYADSIEFHLDHFQPGEDLPADLHNTLLVTVRQMRNLETTAARLAQSPVEAARS